MSSSVNKLWPAIHLLITCLSSVVQWLICFVVINILFSNLHKNKQIYWCRSVYFGGLAVEKKVILDEGVDHSVDFCAYLLNTCAPTHRNYIVQHMLNRKTYRTTETNHFTSIIYTNMLKFGFYYCEIKWL